MASSPNYPEITEYVLPRKNILVLSCIDLRLTDDLLRFLNFDNLTNRYDHFALAGTSLLTQIDDPKLGFEFKQMVVDDELVVDGVVKKMNYRKWKDTWADHVEIAVALHAIKDIYIVEHQDCGAYSQFLKNGNLTGDAEVECHRKFALSLAHQVVNSKKWHLNVHCFFIDLRGNVQHLESVYALAE